MITGFEQYTKELSGDERKIAPLIIDLLKATNGPSTAVSAKKMSKVIAKKKGLKVKGPRIRKMIHEIRVKGVVPDVLASSQGYYVSSDKEQRSKYIKSLNERIDAIKEVRRALVYRHGAVKERGRPRIHQFHSLEVGQSCPADNVGMGSQANLWARRHGNGRRFACRVQKDGTYKLTRIK